MNTIDQNEVKKLKDLGKNSSEISQLLNINKLDVDLYLAELHYNRIKSGRRKNDVLFTKEQFLQAISDLDSGKKYSEVLSDLNLKGTSLCYHFRKSGIDHVSIYKPKKLTQDIIDNIMNDFNSGVPVYKLSEKYKYSKNCLSKFIRKHGGDPTKPSFDINTFHNIDTHEKAYWLGFMCADGNVNESKFGLELQINLEDLNHLIKFKNFLKSTNEIHYKKIKNKYFSCRIAANNKILYDDLISLGCVPNKSLVLKFPGYDKVPKEFIYSFILGYFDGDGCLSYRKLPKSDIIKPGITIAGTKEFLLGIVNEFDSLDYHIYQSRNIYILQIKTKSIEYFLNTIYNCPIHLDRKYYRYIFFKNNKFAVQKSDFLDNDRAISEKSKEFVNNYYKEQIL